MLLSIESIQPALRVETFDDAVQSRINLPLKFKDLDEPARKAIRTTFSREVLQGDRRDRCDELGQPGSAAQLG